MKFLKYSSLKVISQSSPNLAGMILGWSFTKIMSDDPDLRTKWPLSKNSKKGGWILKIFSSETTFVDCNKILLKWFLGGLLLKLCWTTPTSDQNGRQAKNRKKSFLKSSSLKVISQFHLNLAEIVLGWSSTKIGSNDPKLNTKWLHAKNRRKGGFIFRIFSLETTTLILTKCCWNKPANIAAKAYCNQSNIKCF